MQLTTSIITVHQTALAAILVDPGQTFPDPGARLITQAQRYFPTPTIILVTPRIGGFSRSFAHFGQATKKPPEGGLI